MPALFGFLANKIAKGDKSVLLVKLFRGLYETMGAVIVLAFYTGWRAERVPRGSLSLPIPGLYKGGVVNAQALDAAEAEYSPSLLGGSTGNTKQQGTIGTAARGGVPLGDSKSTLFHLALEAKNRFGLSVGEYPPFGPVHNVHARGSLHYLGRAFDASGPAASMRAFALWVTNNYGSHITELIHNPGFSIKNGRRVPPSFWGAATWAAHSNHVHVGI